MQFIREFRGALAFLLVASLVLAATGITLWANGHMWLGLLDLSIVALVAFVVYCAARYVSRHPEAQRDA
jgi:hypothetical protein